MSLKAYIFSLSVQSVGWSHHGWIETNPCTYDFISAEHWTLDTVKNTFESALIFLILTDE